MSPSLSVARGHQERTRHEEGLRHRGLGPLDWLQLGESTSLPSQGLPLSKLLFQCQLRDPPVSSGAMGSTSWGSRGNGLLSRIFESREARREAVAYLTPYMEEEKRLAAGRPRPISIPSRGKRQFVCFDFGFGEEFPFVR